MNAYTTGRIAGVRFAREWKQNLHLWTYEKLAGLGSDRAARAYSQIQAQQRYQQGFVGAVQEYSQQQDQNKLSSLSDETLSVLGLDREQMARWDAIMERQQQEAHDEQRFLDAMHD